MSRASHTPPAAPASPTVLLTSRDLAALLGTTPRQIDNMVARGQVPAPAKIPGLGRRWRREVIEAWLEQVLAPAA
jgi:predicted DNA-binding transcriptional regulator AlpA